VNGRNNREPSCSNEDDQIPLHVKNGKISSNVYLFITFLKYIYLVIAYINENYKLKAACPFR
jgi:hypothetical protein